MIVDGWSYCEETELERRDTEGGLVWAEGKMGKFIARCVLDNETNQDGFNLRDVKGY